MHGGHIDLMMHVVSVGHHSDQYPRGHPDGVATAAVCRRPDRDGRWWPRTIDRDTMLACDAGGSHGVPGTTSLSSMGCGVWCDEARPTVDATACAVVPPHVETPRNVTVRNLSILYVRMVCEAPPVL